MKKITYGHYEYVLICKTCGWFEHWTISSVSGRMCPNCGKLELVQNAGRYIYEEYKCGPFGWFTNTRMIGFKCRDSDKHYYISEIIREES